MHAVVRESRVVVEVDHRDHTRPLAPSTALNPAALSLFGFHRPIWGALAHLLLSSFDAGHTPGLKKQGHPQLTARLFTRPSLDNGLKMRSTCCQVLHLN